MKGIVIADWSKVNMSTPEGRAQMTGALQHFMAIPEMREVRVAMQNYATSGDFPASQLAIMEKYRIEPNYDEVWQEIFNFQDMTSYDRAGFNVTEVEDGLSFRQVARGGSARIFKVGGTLVTIPFAEFGGGLGWHATLFEDREYVDLEDIAIAFRNAYYKERSEIHYALIDAISSAQNLAWQAADGSVPATDPLYLAMRDANTINKACEEILLDLKDSSVPVSAKSRFIALAPIQLMGRIKRALKMVNTRAGDAMQMDYVVEPRYTMMLDSATEYYVCLPKAKARGGNRMNLTIYQEFDAKTRSHVHVGWGRYGSGILEVEQFQRCSTS